MGESWSAETSRCACAASGGCGPERCAGEGHVRAACEVSSPTVRPRYEAPPWMLERRPTRSWSREALVHEVRTRGERDADALGPLGTGLPPAVGAPMQAGFVEDYAEIVALSEEEADALASRPTDPAREGEIRLRREALLRDARQYRDQIVRTVQMVVETAPTAPEMDVLLLRVAGALSGLSRGDEALRAYRALIHRFPRSPYVPHAYLAFADHFFAQRAWEAAAQFYERARLPAEPSNRARAYALYRLAWTRLLPGAPAAVALFEEALAWARAHPDVPDVARLANAARAGREVASRAAAPTRPVPDAADADGLAQAATIFLAAGDWRGSLADDVSATAARRVERLRGNPMNSRRTLTALVALVPQVACLSGTGPLAPPSPAPSQHTTAPATSAPSPVASSDPPVASATPAAPSPAETPPAAPPAPRCTATVGAEVHLRPTATPRTMGAPWPAGTTFEVLGVVPRLRREISGDEDAGVLAEVRVVASGERGWTFVRYTELAPECPLFIEAPTWWNRLSTTPEERADCARAPRHQPVLWYAERGPRRFRPQVLPCCLSVEHWRVVERLDVDGDGVGDEVVRTDRDCMCMDQQLFVGDEAGAAVALLRRPEGWLGVDVVREAEPDRGSHCASRYGGVLRAGAAVYFRWSFEDGVSSEDWMGLPARVRYDPSHEGLTRVDRCGVARVVAAVLPPLAGGCTWTGTADGSVELACRRPARRALLRWDEARFELVPDQPPMPLSTSESR